MADQDIKPKDIKLHAAQPKTKVAFDTDKPLKYGFLKKQGEKTKRCKERFYVLYPNFMVYYVDATKWRFDKTVGRLESRKGAAKLTGARATNPSAEDDISNCKFPFVLYTPDITNKKKRVLLDASSADERKSWIETINTTSESK